MSTMKAAGKTGAKAKAREAGGKAHESFAGVSEMVRGLAGPEFADDFDGHLADRRLATALTVIRCSKEVSQGELAGLMGCAQSKVSKIEASADADLDFGDVVKYATSLGMSLEILFRQGRASGPNHIRFHIESIKRELNRLVNLAGDDEAIGDGVERFAIDQARRMLAVVEDAVDRLPHRARSKAGVSVEAEGVHGGLIPLDGGPRRAPRRTKAAGAR